MEKVELEYTGKEDGLYSALKNRNVKNESAIIEAIKDIEPGHSIGFNKAMEKLFDIPVGELFEKIKNYKHTQYLIIDGILTKRLLSLSINMKINFVACKNKEDEVVIPDYITVHYF